MTGPGETVRVVESSFRILDDTVVELIHIYAGATETFLVKYGLRLRIWNDKEKAIKNYMEVIKMEMERI